MKNNQRKIALGGGCHWCTEAVFQSLKGVLRVEQGYVASIKDNQSFSEAVIVHFDIKEITVAIVIKIHLYTHRSTSNHSRRDTYRSAIYVYNDMQETEVRKGIGRLQGEFENQLITQVLPFKSFKVSRDEIQNYYYNNPKKPFCETFINPKLKLLLKQFSKYVDSEKLDHIKL